MKRLGLLALLSAGLLGCEGMGRYDEYTGPIELHPPAKGPEAVKLVGSWGTFVDSVDGLPVRQQPWYATTAGGGLGGNTTTIEPGPREVRLFVTSNDDYYYTTFVFNFVPGHEYELAKALNIAEKKIRVLDKTSGDFRYVR